MVRISNLELIKLLKDNSRISFVEMARHFGVTETAVRKRVRKLEDEGVIIRYTIDVDTKKIGMNVDALVGVDTRPESYMKVAEDLKAKEEVIKLCTSSGDHMLMIECWFESSKGLSGFVKRLEKMDGITKICPAIIVEKIK